MEEEKIENNHQNAAGNTKSNGQKQIAGAIILAGVLIAGAIMLKGNTALVSPDGRKLVTNSEVFNECLDSGKYAKAVADSTASAANAGVNSTPKLFILQGDRVVDIINGAEPVAMVIPKIEKALNESGGAVEGVKVEPVSNSDFVIGNMDAKVTIIEYADFQCPFCAKFFKETEPTILKYTDEGKVRFIHRDFAFLGNESIMAAQGARCAGDQDKFWEYHDYLYNHQNGENQGNFSNLYLKSFAGELKLK